MNGERIEKVNLSWSKSNEWMVLKNVSIFLFRMFCFRKNRTFILLFLNIVLDLLGKVAGPFFVLSLQLRSHSSWIDPIFITINWLCVTEPFLGSCHGHFLRSNLFSSSSSSNSSSRESWTTFSSGPWSKLLMPCKHHYIFEGNFQFNLGKYSSLFWPL